MAGRPAAWYVVVVQGVNVEDVIGRASAKRDAGFPRWWRRIGSSWLAPSLLLMAGVTSVVESHLPPFGWDSVLNRLVGWALLLLVPPVMLSSARMWVAAWEVEQRPPAVAPTGVRATMADGTVVPLECVYVGWAPRPGGVHVWQAVTADLSHRPAAVDADEIPPYTTVTGLIRRGGRDG